MSELKTKPTTQSVSAFTNAIEDPQQRKDCKALASMMRKITGKKPKLWGTSIVGFGSYHYKYKTGREGDWMMTGFAPRKQNISIYIMLGFSRYGALMKKLGKYKTGKSCLYIKKLDDIDTAVLQQLLAQSLADLAEVYECR